MTMGRDDHRRAHPRDRGHQLGPASTALVEAVGGGGQPLLELGQVAAGTERPTLPEDEYGADVLVGLQLRQAIEHLQHRGVVQGVAAVGTGQYEFTDPATAIDTDGWFRWR
jgi:hypothetical protein